MKVCEMVMVGKEERRRVKVAGTCVITEGKFRPSDISEMVTKPATK